MSLDKVALRAKVKKNGRIVLERQDIAHRLLKHFMKKDLIITIEQEKNKRTLAQNRWLWFAYQVVAQELYRITGEVFTQDEIHAHNLKVIQGFKVITKRILEEDVFIMKGSRSSAWSTKEFNEAKEKLQKWYAEKYGLKIPDPVKQSLITDYEEILKKYR